eukprot:1157849-Pelagomonas_calceolata.AAC.13
MCLLPKRKVGLIPLFKALTLKFNSATSKLQHVPAPRALINPDLPPFRARTYTPALRQTWQQSIQDLGQGHGCFEWKGLAREQSTAT